MLHIPRGGRQIIKNDVIIDALARIANIGRSYLVLWGIITVLSGPSALYPFLMLRSELKRRAAPVFRQNLVTVVH